MYLRNWLILFACVHYELFCLCLFVVVFGLQSQHRHHPLAGPQAGALPQALRTGVWRERSVASRGPSAMLVTYFFTVTCSYQFFMTSFVCRAPVWLGESERCHLWNLLYRVSIPGSVCDVHCKEVVGGVAK